MVVLLCEFIDPTVKVNADEETDTPKRRWFAVFNRTYSTLSNEQQLA